MRPTYYSDTNGVFFLTYKGGRLTDMVVVYEDKITFDALRHEIEIFESDINPEYFKRHDNSV